ncbi:hypothetical protein [Clostridium tyrobutyricum]|uniref:hypothetical protein n=1 Tax=Clostridium tyrobutyricum TaxID=1519 RepID=UPI001C38CB32|nr:hypothetical protein [Clostridium tyrobutyricum]MBV4423553.1 hypothetical protein [Clostridium tyrobutyricum]
MKDDLKTNAISSVNIEGQVGSYMLRQTIYGVNLSNELTYGRDYVIDPIMYFMHPISQKFFNISLRDKMYFSKWINDISNYLPEKYSPMGGFYYIAESIAAFYYFGPALVTFIYALICVYFENRRNKLGIKYILYLALATIFIKTTFQNFFTLSLVISILTYICYIFIKKICKINFFNKGYKKIL